MSKQAAVTAVIWTVVLTVGPLWAQDHKLADRAFVGNWFVFFNPVKGGGTQQLTVDINDAGSYVSMDMQGQAELVRGRFEAQDGKFRLLAKDGSVIDQGTYEPLGPQLQLVSPAGKGFWTKVSGESKQAAAPVIAGDLKAAKFQPIAVEGLKAARTKWRKDAILVEAKVVPNKDGTIDLTVSGGNGTLKFLSPSTHEGCLGAIGNFGEVTLYPQESSVSLSRWSIPTNVIDLESATKTAQDNAKERVTDAVLFGNGEDPDLRQFCWVFTTQSSVVAIDALLGNTTDYREFMDGRPRGAKVPFSPNTVALGFRTAFGGKGPPKAMWYARHAVHLEGMSEAVIIQVPWRVVPRSEIMRHATQDAERIHYRGGKDLYPSGEFIPLTGDVLEQFLEDEDAIRIGCAPFAVRTEKALAIHPAATRERIVKQLESYWRAHSDR